MCSGSLAIGSAEEEVTIPYECSARHEVGGHGEDFYAVRNKEAGYEKQQVRSDANSCAEEGILFMLVTSAIRVGEETWCN